MSAQENDIKLAYALLDGIPRRDKKGLPVQDYLKGVEEKAARQALARLLASEEPLDSLVRRLLAGLFDHDFRLPMVSGAPETRKFAADRLIIFKRVSRRNAEDRRRLMLGIEFWKAMGSPQKGEKIARGIQAKALEAVAEKFKVDDKTIRNAWKFVQTTPWID
jgi:hypothetical protein